MVCVQVMKRDRWLIGRIIVANIGIYRVVLLKGFFCMYLDL